MEKSISQSLTSSISVSKAATVTQILLGSAFLGLLAQFAVPLPYVPAPVTLQTLAVFLLGGVLGARKGALAVLAYLAQASFGLPVLSGGLVNPVWWKALSAGYLFALPLAAFVAGWISEKLGRKGVLCFAVAVLSAQVLVWSLGTAWLAVFLGLSKALKVGVIPFIPGACAKMFVATSFLNVWYRARG